MTLMRDFVGGFVLLLGISSTASAGQVKDAMDFMKKHGCDVARESWLPLAEKGDAVAQFDIGMIYQCGADCGCAPPLDSPNFLEAFKWFKRAADGGNPEAEESVAGYYLDMGRDYSEALRWSRKAAEDGMVASNYEVGQIYQQGYGVPQDYAEAARWFRKGAERGDFEAQSEMAHIYEIGQGVPQDNVEAHMWWNLAAAHEPRRYSFAPGTHSAAEFRDKLAAKMSAAEVAEAQKRAREWKPKR